MFTPQYYEMVLDLTVARTDFRIQMLGNFLYVKLATTILNTVNVKINSPSNPNIILHRHSGIVCAFESLYISNAAQPVGNTMTIFISADVNRLRYFEAMSDAILVGEGLSQAFVYNEVCAVAGAEYVINYVGAITDPIVGYALKARGGPVQFCYAAGQSDIAYVLLADGQSFKVEVRLYALDIYFQSPIAGTVLEIILESKWV